MTTAVFCRKDLVAVHVKYITDICNPRVSKFLKETKRRYLSVQAVKLKSKGYNRNDMYVNGWNCMYQHSAN